MMEGEAWPEPGATCVANPAVDWWVINDDLQDILDTLHQQLLLHFVSISTTEESFVAITVSLLLWHNLLKEKCPGVVQSL